jgi:hypothetical protein
MTTATDRPSFAQPALIGGLVMGVLSALPLVGPVGNICCCLWVVSGGLVAAYVLQQNMAAPITAGDGAVVGLLAGLMGALVHTLVSIPLDFLIGPMERAMALRFMTLGGVIGAALFRKNPPPPGVIDVSSTPSPLA